MRKSKTEPVHINFWLCRLKPMLPHDFSNAMCHHFNYHTNIILHVFPIPCTLICVCQTKTKPVRVGFLFCRPKHLSCVISLLWPSITSTSLYAPPHTFPLPPPHLVLHPRPILSAWTRFSVLQAKTPAPRDFSIVAFYHLNQPLCTTPYILSTSNTSCFAP